MLDRLTRWQLVAFAVVTVLAVGYASFAFVGLPALLGFGRYGISVDLPVAANLYPRALVTLRGVPIGAVGDIDFTDDGVRAELAIDDGRIIPADSVVGVRSVSAIGEQYLNFEPRSTTGRVLGAGDIIPAAQVRLPTDVATLLANVNGFVSTVPADDLNTTVRELAAGLGNSAEDMRRLLDAGGPLVADARTHIDPIRTLLTDLQPVLGTQQRRAADVRSFAGDLRAFTDQLRASDSALRGTIEKTPALTSEVDALVDQVRPSLPSLLSDLTSVGQVVRVYLPNVAHTVTVLAPAMNNVQSAIQRSPVPGTALLNFRATVLNDPPPCTQGFLSEHRDPGDLTIARPVPTFCEEPEGSSIVARGVRNNPCPNDPARRSPDAHGCGMDFQSPEEAAAAFDAAVATQMQVASGLPTTTERRAASPDSFPAEVAGIPVHTPYDSGTGLFVGPDSQPYLVGAGTNGQPAGSDWRSLVLGPLGVPVPDQTGGDR